MKHQFTTRLLAHISSEINSGHALWAMAWANTYLEEKDPLRLGLFLKAKKKLLLDSRFDEEGEAILEHLKAGLSLADLSPVLRQRLRREKEQSAGTSAVNLNFLKNRRSHRTRAQAMKTRRAPRRESSVVTGKAAARSISTVKISVPARF